MVNELSWIRYCGSGPRGTSSKLQKRESQEEKRIARKEMASNRRQLNARRGSSTQRLKNTTTVLKLSRTSVSDFSAWALTWTAALAEQLSSYYLQMLEI